MNRSGPSSDSISAVRHNLDDPTDTSRFWPPLIDAIMFITCLSNIIQAAQSKIELETKVRRIDCSDLPLSRAHC